MTTLLTAESSASARRRGWPVRLARWLISFAGFPLGGLAAVLLLGPIQTPTEAVLGGALSGLVLGIVQSWALRLPRRDRLRWVLATAIGFSVGLPIGATLVGFGAGLSQLALQGAVCGALVGAAQTAVVIRRRMGLLGYVWPGWAAAAWAAGWAVTQAFGVDVESRYTVFGSSGALTAALLTAPFAMLLRARLAAEGGDR